MRELKIQVENYSEAEDAYNEILGILDDLKISPIGKIGMLEAIKMKIMFPDEEDDIDEEEDEDE